MYHLKEFILEPTANIFNIQKFSIHDGPGIRTTVFLKGCPLRCRWCANPESQSPETVLLYDARKCLHCGACVSACTRSAVSFGENGQIRIDRTACRACLDCEHSCPGGALTHAGDEKTVSEVLRVCLQDRDFYEESGGGVTISGGEGMIRPEFTEVLADRLREAGIRTAIETTGFVPEEVFRRLAPKFDLLLFDVKHGDPAKHRAGTGAENGLILKNLAFAVSAGLNILPRIPVIPGFNDGPADAEALISCLKSLGLHKVQLLPFHQLGESKYAFLGLSYAYRDVPALQKEDLADYRQLFLDAGLDCFF